MKWHEVGITPEQALSIIDVCLANLYIERGTLDGVVPISGRKTFLETLCVLNGKWYIWFDAPVADGYTSGVSSAVDFGLDLIPEAVHA